MSEFPADSGQTETLLEASRDGSPGAFEQLFALHRDYIKSVIALRMDPRLRARLDASDLVQETQLEAMRRVEAFARERRVPVRLWLRQIAYEKLREARRRHLGTAGRRVTREVPLPDRSARQLGLLAESSSPSERAARRELAVLVRRAVGHLSETDREILLMRSTERLDYEDIGYVLGIDPAAARQRHARALIRLGKLLAEHGLRESQL